VTNRQADLDKEFLLEQLRAASHRTTADRYRQLLAETTTPALSEYLREMIIRCEALAREGEPGDQPGSL
jgi:hypothetical protein